jgi:hypothetical protein
MPKSSFRKFIIFSLAVINMMLLITFSLLIKNFSSFFCDFFLIKPEKMLSLLLRDSAIIILCSKLFFIFIKKQISVLNIFLLCSVGEVAGVFLISSTSSLMMFYTGCLVIYFFGSLFSCVILSLICSLSSKDDTKKNIGYNYVVCGVGPALVLISIFGISNILYSFNHNFFVSLSFVKNIFSILSIAVFTVSIGIYVLIKTFFYDEIKKFFIVNKSKDLITRLFSFILFLILCFFLFLQYYNSSLCTKISTSLLSIYIINLLWRNFSFLMMGIVVFIIISSFLLKILKNIPLLSKPVGMIDREGSKYSKIIILAFVTGVGFFIKMLFITKLSLVSDPSKSLIFILVLSLPDILSGIVSKFLLQWKKVNKKHMFCMISSLLLIWIINYFFVIFVIQFFSIIPKYYEYIQYFLYFLSVFLLSLFFAIISADYQGAFFSKKENYYLSGHVAIIRTMISIIIFSIPFEKTLAGTSFHSVICVMIVFFASILTLVFHEDKLKNL